MSSTRHRGDDLGWRLYAVMTAIIFAVGIVNALSIAHDHARGGEDYALGAPLFWELTSVTVIAALAPALAAGVRWLRDAWQGRNWWMVACGGVLIVLGFSLVHVVGMVALRKLGAALLGTSYPFAWTFSELTYEFRKDATTCLLLGATFWLTLRRRDSIAAQEARSSAGTSQKSIPEHLWLRDGATTIRVHPRDVVSLSSAGNYVEYRMADGTTHLIRATLAREEPRLKPFDIVRVHRTRMVNLRRVIGVAVRATGDFELRLDVGATLAGSRRYRDAIAGLASEAHVIPLTKRQDGADGALIRRN